MSTLVYAAVTARRKEATEGTSSDPTAVREANPKAGKPGVGMWVDTAAALVPAEVLGVHALLIQKVTHVARNASGKSVVTISDTTDAQRLFWVLLALAVGIYVYGHRSHWDRWDFARMLVPAAAFILWCTLQASTAFDAVVHWGEFTRYLVGIVGVIVLGGAATALAYKADSRAP